MSGIKQHLNDIFRLLRDKPSLMITGDVNSLSSYIHYFQGFASAYNVFIGKSDFSFDREMSIWYYKNYETKKFSLLWSAHFSKKNENMPEREKILLFLDYLEKFIFEELLGKVG